MVPDVPRRSDASAGLEFFESLRKRTFSTESTHFGQSVCGKATFDPRRGHATFAMPGGPRLAEIGVSFGRARSPPDGPDDALRLFAV